MLNLWNHSNSRYMNFDALLLSKKTEALLSGYD